MKTLYPFNVTIFEVKIYFNIYLFGDVIYSCNTFMNFFIVTCTLIACFLLL